MNPMGLRTKSDCAAEDQYQMSTKLFRIPNTTKEGVAKDNMLAFYWLLADRLQGVGQMLSSNFGSV
jgi:hypothetical protein